MWGLLALVVLNVVSGVGHFTNAIQTDSTFARFAVVVSAVAAVVLGVLAAYFYRRSQRIR